MAKKMTEKEVWEYIRKMFYESNLNKDPDKLVSVRLQNKSIYGMCGVLTNLYSNSIISTALYIIMYKKIEFHLGGRIYLYPLSLYGARKRREFCRDRIKEL